ncbi:hypothetical protein [Mycobacterium lepromatosis]|uniref:hypothetical protein n=1 Tax=Mycobacterium lepromatosis TaxID=480418 RepID=UPI0006799DF7|nr:hypothetical protein [Mycobacterium lepromatosis]
MAESAPRRLELKVLWDAGMLPAAVFEFVDLATTLLVLCATQLLSSPHCTATEATSLAIRIYAEHNVVVTVASQSCTSSLKIVYGFLTGVPHSVFVMTLGFALI